MPIYEFTCSGCGASFEALRLRSGDDAPPRCPSCGGGKVSKSLSSFAVSAGAAAGAPRCETLGGCATPNLPGCGRGACGL
ncbi:MAG: zinc ribbon domain-containing protein [Nitrospinae bacterium]|nr:zinc ribbon domain-containing protein [Nitrospinota bacterium]